MKSLITYINEKLILNKNIKPKYNYHPETKKELLDLMRQLIKERGNDGNFNDIDTSNITDMSRLFINNRENFNGDISKWDVSNVTNMKGMFEGCKLFNRPLNDWDVSSVENMESMFCHCESFNQPLDKWDVSNVDNMWYMFNSCTSFNQDISKWNTSKASAMWTFTKCPIEEKYKPKFR
jgi:surface protein